MKALILRADANASVKTARALIDKGFQILSVDTQAVAHALIRVDTIDLLVMDERIEGQLTHAIALSGERKNPYLSAILLTDRGADETDDLYDLIPCLYGLAGADTAPDLLGKLALSAVSSIEVTSARVAQNTAADAAEDMEPVEMDTLILAANDMSPPDDDSDSGVPCFADVSFAAPAMAEIAAADNRITLERVADVIRDGDAATLTKDVMLEHVEDAVSAEVAALFRRPIPPQQVQPPQSFAAKAG
ncbi:hypothetical protein [Roseobacter sp. CCS2]|uniref:hypothetical protein n=1 Tax=Roseobacter sp. CCS2 TaxID=391593 RepID=UPI0000F3E070|nr:hypothetical protein [Roseobacter sp. CCS2]EBA12773.1 hypothetical protein RCCS2_15789 [Roseobacter sp. CCS2]